MSSTQEVWVDIRNYEGYYQISNKGRIKSLEREVSHDGITYTQPERILCHWCGTTSLYDRVRLYKEGIGTKFTVHRLVAEYFLEDWNPRLEVNHLDGNRYNNAADNLEMCTHQRKPQCKTDQCRGGSDTGCISRRRSHPGEVGTAIQCVPADRL